MSKLVLKTGKDSENRITSICGYDWSKSRLEAVKDINEDPYSYYVEDDRGRSYLHVYAGEWLRTDRDMQKGNNLDELPDC